MTVKELMDYLKDCPEDANINVKNYIDSIQHSTQHRSQYRIEELAGFFDGVKNVVNIYISQLPSPCGDKVGRTGRRMTHSTQHK